MSNSENQNLEGSVHLRCESGPVEMRLRNHHFQTVAVGFGEIEATLPAGLYRLEINAGPLQKAEHISLEPGGRFENLHINISFPSATPIPGTTTTHEFHGDPAALRSRNPNQHYGEGGRLLLFFRNVGADWKIPINIDSFSLLDASFKTVGNLPEDVEKNEADGWIALSAEVNPGGYVLRNQRAQSQSWSKGSKAEEPVDQSLWISEGWATLVFIPNWGSRAVPSMRKASIHMAPIMQGFYYYGAEQMKLALELALYGLREGRPVVPGNLLNLLLEEKFQNPMLGIIGAHAMLLESRPNWSLYDEVCKNLELLVPQHPDVVALQVMGQARRDLLDPTGRYNRLFNPNPHSVGPWRSISWPPMLYASYRGLIEGDADKPGLIVDGSPAEKAAVHLYQEGPWSMWKSLGTVSQKKFDYELLKKISDLEMLLKNSAHDSALNIIFGSQVTAQEEEKQETEKLNAIEIRQVLQYIDEFSRLSIKRRDRFSDYDHITVQDLSKSIGLPVSAVKRAIRTISKQGFGKKSLRFYLTKFIYKFYVYCREVLSPFAR